MKRPIDNMISLCFTDFMHRTMIQLDENLYEELKRHSFEKGLSLSALVRKILAKSLKKTTKKNPNLKAYKFIGSSASQQKNISQDHDEYLGKDL